MKLIHTITLIALAACLSLASCDNKKAPMIANETAKELSPTVILVEADITGEDLSAYGVCFSGTNQLPSLQDGTITEGALEGDHFQARIIIMDPGNSYYFRVYATNDKGTTYSETLTVTVSYQNVGAHDNAYPTIQ